MRWWLCPPRNSVLHIDCIHAHVSQYKQAQTRWQRRAQHPEASLCLSTGTTPTTTQTQTQTHRHRHTDTHTVTGCTRSSRDAERPTCSADVPSVTFSATWLRNPCTPIPCVCIRTYMSVSYIDVYICTQVVEIYMDAFTRIQVPTAMAGETYIPIPAAKARALRSVPSGHTPPRPPCISAVFVRCIS